MITCNRCKTLTYKVATMVEDGELDRHLCNGCSKGFDVWLREPALSTADLGSMACKLLELLDRVARQGAEVQKGPRAE